MVISEADRASSGEILQPQQGHINTFGIGKPLETPETVPTVNTYIAHGTVPTANSLIEYNAEFPETLVYDGWALIGSGFGGLEQTYRPLLHALALEGFFAATFTPQRNDDHSLWEQLSDPQQLHVDTIEALASAVPQNPEVREILGPYRLPNFKRLLLLPHSMHGIPAARYAAMRPDTVDAILNLASVGYGSPTLGQLAITTPTGIIQALKHELIPYLTSGDIDISIANVLGFIHYFAKNPARTAGELISCLRTDIRPVAEQLDNRNVKNAFIAMQYDCLIPPNDNIADTVDLYHVLPGTGHLSPQVKAAKVARAAKATLQQLHLAA